MTTDFRALCAELAEDVRYLSECLRDPENGVDPVCLSECEDDLHRARAALAQPSPEGELTDEELLHVWRFNFAKTDQTRFLDISRAAIAADRARRPAPEPPAEGEVGELVDQLAGDQEIKIYRLPDLNGTIDSSKSSVPQPVPVSERLPGPEDCLDEGWAWFFNPRTGWRQATQPVHTGYTHWLPAHALPLPSPAAPEAVND